MAAILSRPQCVKNARRRRPRNCIYDYFVLRWRHNGSDSVSNHQPHHCFPNRLFRRRSKKTSKLRVTGLRGIHWGPVNSPHKWSVTRKMFPFDDVIMVCILLDIWVPSSHWGQEKLATVLQTAVSNLFLARYCCILFQLHWNLVPISNKQ